MRPKPFIVLSGTVALILALTGGAAHAQTASAGFSVTLDNGGQVLDASGRGVSEDIVQGDEFESISQASLPGGSPLRVLRQSAPPIAEDPVRQTSVSATKLQAAKEHKGVLPADLVGTDFVEGSDSQLHRETVHPGPVDSSDASLNFVQAIASDAVAFAWRPTGESYRITRDGVLVADVATPTFTESGLAPGRKYVYSIESFAADGTRAGSRTWETQTLTTREVSARSLQPLTYQAGRSAAFHATFIADPTVPFTVWQNLGCGILGDGYAFQGDNRTFAVPESVYYNGSARTQASIEVDWAGQYFEYGRSVGSTNLLQNGNYVDSRTASYEGIQWSQMGVSTSFAQARLNVDVGNPWCLSGDISTAVTFRWYRTGTFEVVGSRIRVPHHEIYGGWDNGSGGYKWRAFAQLPNEGFQCLVLNCGTQGISETRTY